MLVTRNLPEVARTFGVSVSLLQSIMPPLRLMGLTIVTVVLMKEPLLNVTSPTIDEEFRVRVIFLGLLLRKIRD